MTEGRKAALKILEKNMKPREIYESQPIIKTTSNIRMSHEKDAEIGERILKKKVFGR